jgi:hypothetical protein
MKSEIKKKNTSEKKFQVEKERAQFKSLLLKNPNYFGNFPDYKKTAVLTMSQNTKYEELKCVGFIPEEDKLEAIFDVKMSEGYKGSLCSAGSYEYIRFFVDWNGDGKYDKPEDDLGITSVNVHDIPDGEYDCVNKSKPLSYAVTLKIDSKKNFCTIPNLVKVRAILSWDLEPTAGNPDYKPTWGNVIEKWIQIKPLTFLVKDVLDTTFIKKLNIAPTFLKMDTPVSEEEQVSPEELQKLYQGKNVPEYRYNQAHILQIAEKVKQQPNLIALYKSDPKLSQLVEQIDLVLAENPSTKFEQLNCLGLNYDMDTLIAILNVKLSNGYSGGLCTAGSFEYVAFWAYEMDMIEHVCIWKYLGTAKVNVHDIKNTEGLNYAVCLKYDFSGYKNDCSKPKILIIRAILSWNKPPPLNNPSFSPIWGNSLDAVIQLKPLLIPPLPGQNIPEIIGVGGITISNISGNTPYGITSVLGDGYANGTLMTNGEKADDSPFGGSIQIRGTISYPPANPTLRYKVQYRKSNEKIWFDMVNSFVIKKIINNIQQPDTAQTIDSQGYYLYQVGGDTKVDLDVLGNWISSGDGYYKIRVLLEDPNAPQDFSNPPWDRAPLGHSKSNIVTIVVDNSIPDPDITMDFISDEDFFANQKVIVAEKKPCGKVNAGKYIIGRFQAKDKLLEKEHYGTFSFEVLPRQIKIGNQPPPFDTPQNFKYAPNDQIKDYSKGIIGTEGIKLPPPPTTSQPPYPPDPVTGEVSNGIWQLNTAGMLPCGYVVVIHVSDRTIINSGRIGWPNNASVGFCLEN